MRSVHTPFGGAFSRRFSTYSGIFFDEFAPDSAWIRDTATIRLPPLESTRTLTLRGEFRPHPDARGLDAELPSLDVLANDERIASLSAPAPGPWQLDLSLPAGHSITITLRLGGVTLTNTLAYLGRITGLGAWQRFRAQNKNRQLRLRTLATADGEIIYDFSQRDAPLARDFVRRHARLGLNIVGFLAADLGVGESARCMVRAADAAGIATALVPLRLNCKNRLGDETYRERFTDENTQPVNVIHVDPPAARDIEYHHGKAFTAGKYNIGYFAWELPEFPDAWQSSFDYFDEIWCPSDFAAEAIRLKSPVPVLTMPHAISFPRGMDILPMVPSGTGVSPVVWSGTGVSPVIPSGTASLPAEAFGEGQIPPVNSTGPDRHARPLPPTTAQLRARFALPVDAFLFLSLFDLNSYSARKNPRAAIEAFRLAALPAAGTAPAGLVIKVQNVAGNEADFAALQQSVRDLPNVVLLTDTLSRADIYALEAACDCFVSLHRSEGFGLVVAECMYLGKPVISTDWSATAEFVDATNGCPVRARLITLERSHGPYAKGSTWAEPDATHAAEYMRRLFADRELAARLGAAARATIEQRFSPVAIGARYRRRLESIATF